MAKARHAGVNLTVAAVQKIRSAAKVKRAKGTTAVAKRAGSRNRKWAVGAARKGVEKHEVQGAAPRAKKPTAVTSTAPARPREAVAAEDLLRAVAAELGIGKAIQILEA